MFLIHFASSLASVMAIILVR